MEYPHRILFICHDGHIYGSQQSLSLIVQNLPTERYRCLVSVARPGPLVELLQQNPQTRVIQHRRIQWVKHDQRSPLQKIGDCINLLAVAPVRVFSLWRLIRREKIDIVHSNSTVSLEGALAAALAGVPHIWHIRELFMEENPKFHLVLGRYVSRWLIDRLSTGVICISEAVRNQFSSYLQQQPEKYRLIHNALPLRPALLASIPGTIPEMPGQRESDTTPVTEESCFNALQLKGFTIGYIGRLSVGKGFHDLLAAFILLRKSSNKAPAWLESEEESVLSPKLKLRVAGSFVDVDYERRIQETIAKNPGLAEDIEFLGYVSNLAPVYNTLAVLVVPSLNEPFGRVVIEAMANGVACIGTNAGGIPEIIDNDSNGLLYEPGNPEQLAAQLKLLMQNRHKLETIRQNAGRMVYERFNIETQIRTLEKCYQSVIARPLRP